MLDCWHRCDQISSLGGMAEMLGQAFLLMLVHVVLYPPVSLAAIFTSKKWKY